MTKKTIISLLFFCSIAFLFKADDLLKLSSSLNSFRLKLHNTTPGAIKKKAPFSQINVTASPYEISAYLSDFKLIPGNTILFNSFIPLDVTLKPDLLKDSAFQFIVGKKSGKYRLQIALNPGSTNAEVHAVLLDSKERPIYAWNVSRADEKSMEVAGGVYKLVLSCSETLGKDYKFQLKLQSILPASPLEATDDIQGIPQLNLGLNMSSLMEFNFLTKIARKKIVDAGGKGQRAKGLPTASVDGIISHANNEISRVGLSLSGVGFGGHFDKKTPSFTVRTYSGPLFMGMTRFKLYSIKVKEGLLDYVAGSLMRDEGLFAPRWMLVHLLINGESRGIYVLEETPSSEFFAGRKRYDGRIYGRSVKKGKNRDYFRPRVPQGFPKYKPFPSDFDYTQIFAKRTHKRSFAKSLALLSHFQCAHATQESDFRFYQHPFLYEFEPVIRDMNFDYLPAKSEGYRGFLTHSSWWYGKRIMGRGAIFNPLEYPKNIGTNLSYVYNRDSLRFASIHPMAVKFLDAPQNRELFERYLFYYNDPVFHKRLAIRLQSTLDVCRPFLGADNDWVVKQVKDLVHDTLQVEQYLPELKKKSTLLAYEKTVSKNEIAFTLYNLSPFSLRLTLPEHARITGRKNEIFQFNTKNIRHYLSPSDLFGMVVGERRLRNPDPTLYLTRSAAKGVLELEKTRFETNSSSMRGIPSPFLEVVVPAVEKNQFLKFLIESGLSGWSDNSFPLTGDHLKKISDLNKKIPSFKGPITLKTIFANAGDSASAHMPELIRGPRGHAGYKFNGKSYLSTNISVENWQGFSASFWLYVSKAVNKKEYAIIFDLNHSLKENGVLLLASRHEPGLVNLAWYCGGKGISIPLSIKKWHHLVVTGDFQSKRIALFLNGQKMSQTISPFALWKKGASITIGKWGRFNDRYFEGMIADAVFIDVSLTRENVTKIWNNTTDEINQKGKLTMDEIIENKLTIYPIDVIPTENGFLLNYILANQSNKKIQVDPSRLKPKLFRGSPIKVVSWKVRTILGEKKWYTDPITLDKAFFIDHLPSNLWTETLQGFINHPGNHYGSNIAILQVEVETGNASGIIFNNIPVFDNGSLAIRPNDSPSSAAKDIIPVVINEPFKSILPPLEEKITPLLPDIFKNYPSNTDSNILRIAGKTPDNVLKYSFISNNVVIPESIIIPEGALLEILPGTNLFFEENAGLLIYGNLSAIGTEQNPIRFGPVQNAKNWRGIALVGSGTWSKMKNVLMERAGGGKIGPHIFSGGLSVYRTQLNLSNCRFKNFSSNDTIHYYNSRFTIEDTILDGSTDDGLDSDWSYGTINKSYFTNIAGDGVDFSGSNVLISNSLFEKNEDKGISIGEGSVLRVENCKLHGNKIAVAIKDQSIAKILGCDFVGNETGTAVYIKKPMYEYPSFSFSNNNFSNNSLRIVEKSRKIWTDEFN